MPETVFLARDQTITHVGDRELAKPYVVPEDGEYIVAEGRAGPFLEPVPAEPPEVTETCEPL